MMCQRFPSGSSSSSQSMMSMNIAAESSPCPRDDDRRCYIIQQRPMDVQLRGLIAAELLTSSSARLTTRTRGSRDPDGLRIKIHKRRIDRQDPARIPRRAALQAFLGPPQPVTVQNITLIIRRSGMAS